MNDTILKEKFPKSIKILKEWILNEAVKFGLDPKHKDTISIDLIMKNVILTNPRILYDFFDDHQIHMFVIGSIEWQFKIVETGNHDNSANETKYTSRKLSEDTGFSMAFEILEKKLN